MILEIILCVLLLALFGGILLAWKRINSIERLQTELDRSARQLIALAERLNPSPGEAADFDEVMDAFRAYIQRESHILQHTDFGESGHPHYIGYESGYPRETWTHEIWIAAWLSPDCSEVAAIIAVRSSSNYFNTHYRQFEVHTPRIEQTFSFEEIKFKRMGNGIYHLRVEKQSVDLTQTANWETEFGELRENLERLYWVLRVHDTLGWGTPASIENLVSRDT